MPHGSKKVGTHPFAQFVRYHRELRGYGVNELARLANMSPSYLSRIEAADEGELSVSEKYVGMIAGALDVDLLQALAKAGHILPSEAERFGRRESFESFVARDRRLSVTDRRTLITLYQVMVGGKDANSGEGAA